MRCPKCGHNKSEVIDSRPSEEGASIRRRRECRSCQNRFTTYETVEKLPLLVIKKDKTRQAFDKNKLLNGIIEACHKRPITLEQMEAVANEIESELHNSLTYEVPSSKIGVLVMEKLKELDEVAYVRFASVYRQFKDINTFMNELKLLLGEQS